MASERLRIEEELRDLKEKPRVSIESLEAEKTCVREELHELEKHWADMHSIPFSEIKRIEEEMRASKKRFASKRRQISEFVKRLL